MRVWTKSEGEGENRFAVVSFAHFFSLKSRSPICFSLNGHHIPLRKNYDIENVL
jgi:hypothetical protein